MMIFYANLRHTASLGDIASTLNIWGSSTVIGPILTHGRGHGRSSKSCLASEEDADLRRQLAKPDFEDPDTVDHRNYYLSTGFTRSRPGERTVPPERL